MRDINQVVITGHLTKDPELRATPSGRQVLSLSVAVNDRVKNQAGGFEDRPNFVDCVVFGAPAEWLSRELRKGSGIAGSGRLRFSTWERDGQRRSKIEVVLDDVRRLASRDEAAVASTPEAGAPADAGLYDQDVPF